MRTAFHTTLAELGNLGIEGKLWGCHVAAHYPFLMFAEGNCRELPDKERVCALTSWPWPVPPSEVPCMQPVC